MVTYTFDELLAHKEAGVPEAALAALREWADGEILKPTYKVTEIPLPRPSGNMHEYMSVSPYRWPNPDTPDGLPWVRRDGVNNPDVAKNPRAVTVYSRVYQLALAAFYFEEKRTEYAEFATRQLYDWFINPETYMEPNARYAQSIPGVCDGCSPGIIDFAVNAQLFDGIGILEALGLVDAPVVEGVKAWFVEFTNWLMTNDELGIAEGSAGDNHGAWYDEQVLAAAVFTGRKYLVQRVLRSSYNSRTRAKIKLDGSQPHELKRTKPIGYSFYALKALFEIANIGEVRGYSEYWGIDAERGHCVLRQAVDFLYPYVKDPSSCPYPDLKHGKYGENMKRALLRVAKHYPGEGYEEKAAEFGEYDSSLWRLAPLK